MLRKDARRAASGRLSTCAATAAAQPGSNRTSRRKRPLESSHLDLVVRGRVAAALPSRSDSVLLVYAASLHCGIGPSTCEQSRAQFGFVHGAAHRASNTRHQTWSARARRTQLDVCSTAAWAIHQTQ